MDRNSTGNGETGSDDRLDVFIGRVDIFILALNNIEC